MSQTPVIGRPGPKLYYEELGRGHDDILRCNGCQKLVTYQTIVQLGQCPKCGTKRMIEVTSLTLMEWLRIRLGLLSFPYSAKFLEEFNRVKS
jgi:DNA-directed RNA polymerase subunit RPC12/RpoP